jgi:Protein of unknown function (DUF3341)
MIALAEFPDAGLMVEAARGARRRQIDVLESFTPYPVEELSKELPSNSGRIRIAMFIGGVFMAAAAYLLEYYSAVFAYPYNSGGRPFHAWPTFMLVPFATGILLASITGFVAFLAETGLPRLHHPFFAVEGFERASQDRFLLALAVPDGEDAKRRMLDWLREIGATAIREVDA